MTGNLLPVFAVAEPERASRLRELRMAALLLLGRQHPLTQALGDAIANPEALAAALSAVDDLAAIPRRRLLATMATVLPAVTHDR